MAKAKTEDRVKQIATAAVIKALGAEGGDLVAEMTADILNEKESDRNGLGFMYRYAFGADAPDRSYLESLARAEITRLVQDAVKEYFAARAAELKQQVIDRISVENIADSYMAALHSAFENDAFTIDIGVSPRRDEDGDYD